VQVPVIPGQQIALTGGCDPGTHWTYVAPHEGEPADCVPSDIATFTGVTVTLDDGHQVAATDTDALQAWAKWSAAVTFTQGGIHTATAVASATKGAQYTAKLSVFVAPASPDLSVTQPVTGATVGVGAAGGTVKVVAVTADNTQYGGFKVIAQPDFGTAATLTLTPGSTTQWTGSVVLTGTPLGARSLTVTCSYDLAPQRTHSVTVTLQAADEEPPEAVAITDPLPSGTVIPDATMTIYVKGTASDSNSGMTGGSAKVAVALSPTGPFAPAAADSGDDWSAWTATVKVPGYGSYTLYALATDAAGNQTPSSGPWQWPFEAISSYVPPTLDDRLSDLEYLSALMQFIRDQVSAGKTGTVSSSMLASALGQPLDTIAAAVPGSATALAAQAPVNELRVPAEILRGYIAANAIPAGPGAAAEAAYLSAAYQALLAGAGTSYAELRLARGASDTARQALAGRLGIALHGDSAAQPRPDQLDALTLDGPALTEAALEVLFALSATTAGLDPLRTIQPPRLLGWRVTAQQGRWQAEDASPPSPVAYAVIVDPDIVTAADVLPNAPSQVGKWLSDRGASLTGQVSALERALAGASNASAQLAALLGAGLPAGTDLASLSAQDQQGTDISGELAAAGLDRNGFAYLVQLQALASAGLVNATEWAAAVDVLTGAFRRRQYPAWAADEAQLPAPIVLSPDNFQLTDAGPALSAFRIDPRARADWQATLRIRTIERQALTDEMTSLVSTTEQATLGILRDALLADIAAAGHPADSLPTVGDIAGAAAWLASRYEVDVTVSGSQPTTRLAQATASLQALLLLIRSGDNTSVTGAPFAGWQLTNPDEAVFDAAWAWMGTYGSWQSATTAFLFPEAALDPALLREYADSSAPSFTEPDGCSPAFRDLLTGLADSIGPPDTSADGPLEQYLTAIQAPGPPAGILAATGVLSAGQQLTYFGDQPRSPSWQKQMSAWCAQLTKDKDTGLAREVFWAVPMLVGQRLHAAGQYQAALDWLWVVYPYNAASPVSSYDVINTELATTTPVPPDLAFPPDWTSRLNPFQLVWSGTPPYPYTRPYTWIRNTLLAIISCLADYADSEFSAYTAESVAHARDLYATAARLLAHPALTPVKPATAGEPALGIPQISTLSARVAAQQAKLRQDRDIAGLPQTQAVSTGNPVSQPTPYHFKVLLVRAQQLAQQAATIEAEYLSALEKYDNKTLQVSDARNAANVAALQLPAEAAKIQQATDAITAATAQQTKATTMVAQYNSAINAPPNQYEQALLANYTDMRTAQDVIAGADATIGIAQAVAGTDVLKIASSFGGSAVAGGAEIVGYGVKAAAQMWANNLQSQAQANQLQAGIEARKQQWQIEQASANQDALIAAAQVTTANDQKDIATAEQAVATAQNKQAQATLAMLTTQFTSPDLYKWMSDTLGGVYRYFLQQATATARLAQAQLAFERAEQPQAFVRLNYWQPPAQLAGLAALPETRGMTGAEQLAEDLSQLDQYAFSTDTRRLNLTQSFSLSQLLPVEFVDFLRTGLISFTTPIAWFDQDFPGHYQRLIRQVSVSVVALVPPSRGIRATLSASGISQVTAANDGTFSQVTLRRDPQTVAFTSPVSATGVFQVDLQPDMLLPFEGSGVATSWDFSLPPAANPFDFTSISDVLISIDYTALIDPGYQAQVIRALNANLTRSADCVFSLVQDFPDQWYALNNPGPPPAARDVTLAFGQMNFPAGISPGSLATTQIAVRLSASGPLAPVPVTLSRGAASGSATTDDGGIASTRRGAGGWNSLIGTSPVGDWTLSFDASADPLFAQGALADVLLIISWTGQARAWPT
jgi:hypothetical protein